MLDASDSPEGSATLLARLLRHATPTSDAEAAALLSQFGSLSATLRAEPKDFLLLPDIPRSTRLMLYLVGAIIDAVIRDQALLADRRSNVIYTAAFLHLRGRPIEYCVAYLLDANFNLISSVVLSKGTVDHCPLWPQLVTRQAIAYRAAAVLLAHNHPSGDFTPSQADIQMTIEIKSALWVFGVELYDHVVVGSNGYFSIAHRSVVTTPNPFESLRF